MSTTRVNFRIPDELLEKADIAASVQGKNRTEVVTEALRAYLAEAEDEDAFREALIERYLEGEIGFEVLRAFIGRRDAEAVRASKRLLDAGEDAVDELADR